MSTRALSWAIGNAIVAGWTDPAPEAIVIGALAMGAFLQLPLATSGENILLGSGRLPRRTP
jgi:hypothetical protein